MVLVKNTLPQRLERLFIDLGINQIDFARRIGFTQPYLSQILNGSKKGPSPRFFDVVRREFNVNPEWLKTGKGEIFFIPGAEDNTEDAEILAKYRLLSEPQQRVIKDMIKALLIKSIDEKKITVAKKK